MRAVFFGACAERNEGRETLENVKNGGRRNGVRMGLELAETGKMTKND